MPRPKPSIPTATLQVSLPGPLMAKLQLLALSAHYASGQAYGIRAAIVREALEQYFTRLEAAARQEHQDA
jgi:hypothetical protein